MIILRKLSNDSGVSANIVLADTLFGDMDGLNRTFITYHNYQPGQIIVNYNGQSLVSTEDFIETANNVITLNYITPLELDVLTATYARVSTLNIVLAETLGGVNGITKTFNTLSSYLSGKIIINYNGQSLVSTEDFIETSDKEITLTYITPIALDVLTATYETETYN